MRQLQRTRRQHGERGVKHKTRIMEIAIMDYQSGTIRTIKDCPDEWQTEQIEDYLYNTLGYRESDIYYMCGTISHTEETYAPQSEKE